MARTPSADFLERQAASLRANTVSICCSLTRKPNPKKRATDYLEDGLTYKHAYILEAISLRIPIIAKELILQRCFATTWCALLSTKGKSSKHLPILYVLKS